MNNADADDADDVADDATDDDIHLDPDEPFTVLLQHPIEWGSRTVSEIVLRPVTGADFRRLKTPTERPLAMTLELAGLLSGQPYQIIDKIKGRDLGAVIEVTNFFLRTSQGTGLTR